MQNHPSGVMANHGASLVPSGGGSLVADNAARAIGNQGAQRRGAIVLLRVRYEVGGQLGEVADQRCEFFCRSRCSAGRLNPQLPAG